MYYALNNLENSPRFGCYFGMLRMLYFISFFLFSPCLSYCSPFSNKFHAPLNDGPRIVSLLIEHYSHQDFKRISEYFNGGREHHGHKCIVRDDPSKRDGLYFVVNFDRPLNALPKEVSVNVYILLKQELMYEKFSFTLPNKRPHFVAETHLGITSKKIDRASICAWRVDLVGPHGEKIATRESYMWPKIYQPENAEPTE